MTTTRKTNHSFFAGPVRPELDKAVGQFNRREFFACHETLEDLWRPEGVGPVRDLYQGILLVGVACLHEGRGNLAGARKCIWRGIALLQPLPPSYEGIRVKQLLDQARVAAESIERRRQGSDGGLHPYRVPIIEVDPVPQGADQRQADTEENVAR